MLNEAPEESTLLAYGEGSTLGACASVLARLGGSQALWGGGEAREVLAACCALGRGGWLSAVGCWPGAAGGVHHILAQHPGEQAVLADSGFGHLLGYLSGWGVGWLLPACSYSAFTA